MMQERRTPLAASFAASLGNERHTRPTSGDQLDLDNIQAGMEDQRDCSCHHRMGRRFGRLEHLGKLDRHCRRLDKHRHV